MVKEHCRNLPVADQVGFRQAVLLFAKGNFIDSALRGASTAANKGIKSGRYEPIPYASEQGIFCGLAGNLNKSAGRRNRLARHSFDNPSGGKGVRLAPIVLNLVTDHVNRR